MKKIVSLLAIFVLLLNMIPVKTEAVTLADYRKLLKKYKEELAEAQASINKTEDEIKETNNTIKKLNKEMIALSGEISVLKDDIIKYEEEIAAKELETKRLFEYIQLSEGTNAYLEYAFESTDMTDLIYRMAVAEQILEYNEEKINELNSLIEKSEERKIEINKREKAIEKKQEELEELLVSLGEEKSILSESGVSSSKQIKLYEDQIEKYKKLGCGEYDVIGKDCAVIGSIGNWQKPITKGYITSEYGYRTITINGKTSRSLHRGVDMSNGNPYQTKIYSIGNGRISQKYKDNNGALCVITEHKDGKKTYTATYCHLSKYNPKIYVGMTVTSDTWLGYMGNTGLSSGPHLHFEIIDCNKLEATDDNCSTWNKYVKYAEKRYKDGFKGPRGFISFPKGKYNSWSSR